MRKKMSEKIVPKGTRVLVSREAPDDVSEGGIIILSDDAGRMREFSAETRATVIALGSQAFEDNLGDKPEIGEHVIIRRYSGVAVDADAKYGDVMVNDHDVLARVDEE
jgi:co-chaperonin GroES (HSP10)